MIVQSVIATCERERQLASGVPQLPKAAEMEMPKLPKLLRILCRRLPSSYRPAMVIASLPVLGTLATKIRFEYLDMQEQSLSFFSCITAPAASGKSFIRRPIDLLLTPINEQDKIEREKEQQMADIKGEMKKIEWGSQIRSYVFQPYTMVKDHRTNYETGNIDDVMDGNLEGFVTAYLKMQ